MPQRHARARRSMSSSCPARAGRIASSQRGSAAGWGSLHLPTRAMHMEAPAACSEAWATSAAREGADGTACGSRRSKPSSPGARRQSSRDQRQRGASGGTRQSRRKANCLYSTAAAKCSPTPLRLECSEASCELIAASARRKRELRRRAGAARRLPFAVCKRSRRRVCSHDRRGGRAFASPRSARKWRARISPLVRGHCSCARQARRAARCNLCGWALLAAQAHRCPPPRCRLPLLLPCLGVARAVAGGVRRRRPFRGGADSWMAAHGAAAVEANSGAAVLCVLQRGRGAAPAQRRQARRVTRTAHSAPRPRALMANLAASACPGLAWPCPHHCSHHLIPHSRPGY